MHLEKVERRDKEEIFALSSGIWDGNDYLPKVFDEWVGAEGFYKGVHDGRIIGVCKYSRQPGGILWLEGLRVHPEYQGEGHGSAIAAMFHERLLGMDHTALRFMTDITNIKSKHLAKKRGFRVMLELYHLEHEGGGEPVPEVKGEYDVEAVTGYVLGSRELDGYKGLYISNWTAFELTEELLKVEVEEGRCYSVRTDEGIRGLIFVNHHRRYGRVSVPFMAGSGDITGMLIRHAIHRSGVNGDGFLLLKTPFEEVRQAGERAGMGLTGYRKVIVFERRNEEVL